jgi:D-3-phosphoglycerate dehydrogenase / 2-oxoglutarate reductase
VNNTTPESSVPSVASGAGGGGLRPPGDGAGEGRERPRVLIREEIAAAGVDLLRERFDVDVEPNGELADTIGAYDAIVVRSATKLTADVLSRAERLKVIGRAGVGVDNVDVEEATRRGIVVANAPESTVVSAAEHTIGLLVALSRNIPQAHAALKQGRWERGRYGGIELEGKTLGVLGFGRIGQQVTRRALGLGIRVVAYDPFVARERFRELGVERVDTPDEAYAAAEFVTLHLPLTDETRGAVGSDAFARMRDGVRLINAARGELVDESALLNALRSGKVAAAALDVFPAEPYEGPLLELDNVVVTPHLAASTEEAQDRAGVIVAEQVAAALEGALVTNAVNIPAIRAEDMEALGPFVPLAAKLGRLAMELAGGRAERIALAYYGGLSGYDTRLLTVAALNGAFQGRSDTPVNYVNAPVIAAERGIEVLEERRRASRDFTNLVRVGVHTNGDDVRVAGTTIGNDNRHWLVSALGFELEMELAPLLVFFRYDDVPGVIGRVGSLFGEAGVNIANMAVSRTRRGGKALMALSLDTPPPEGLVEEFRKQGFDDARFISLT